MEKIFYTDISAFPSSNAAVEHILARQFDIGKAKISRTKNGKPYLQSPCGLFFSVAHTKSKLFIAFSDKSVGIDAEEETRPVATSTLLSKFTAEERTEIQTPKDFLLHWTAKESAVKWLGGTLARDLKKLSYSKNTLSYGGLEIPVFLTHLTVEKHILSICSERDFSTAEVLSL